MTATPRPWVAHKQKNVGNMPWGQLTDVCTQEEQGRDTVYSVLAENCTEADAALIVKAVNTHDRAKAVLQGLVSETIGNPGLLYAYHNPSGCENSDNCAHCQQVKAIKTLLTDMEG